jgi:hypothetical protein
MVGSLSADRAPSLCRFWMCALCRRTASTSRHLPIGSASRSPRVPWVTGAPCAAALRLTCACRALAAWTAQDVGDRAVRGEVEEEPKFYRLAQTLLRLAFHLSGVPNSLRKRCEKMGGVLSPYSTNGMTSVVMPEGRVG